jgi:PAT family beta-lactamase induction signal transducer AmpG
MIGGALAARYSVKRVFFPLAFALNVPHITYFYLSQTLPDDVYVITTVVAIEKFGYGMGTCGMMLYMMQQLAPGAYKTAHYAFATGIMALTMMLTGMVSGKIQEVLGYQHFFVFVLLASVPPIVIAWFAPFPHPGEVAGPASPAES